MIRLFSLSVHLFINTYLRPHKRTTMRISLLQVLTYPFKIMMDEWKAYRNEAVIRSNITAEKMSIEWYLNYRFDPTLQRIYIETANGGGVPMGIEAIEPTAYQVMGIEATEPTDYVLFSLPEENPTFGTASFAVFVPDALAADADAISAATYIYAFGGKSYKINLYS